MKSKKGIIDDFGGLLIGGLIIALLVVLFLVFLNAQKKSNQYVMEVYANELEALQTTRTILEWKINQEEYLYERIIELYKDYKKQEIINLIIETIEEINPEPGKWLIAIDEYSPEQIVGGINLKNSELIRLREANKFLPKTSIPNPYGDSAIKILIKKVTNTDYALVNIGKSSAELIELSQRAHDADITVHEAGDIRPGLK